MSGYQFYNTSGFDLAELVNDSEHLAANFKAYIQGFSANIQDIIRSLDFDKQIDKMDKNNRLLSVVKAFSELDLDPRTIDNVKMGTFSRSSFESSLKMPRLVITTRAATSLSSW